MEDSLQDFRDSTVCVLGLGYVGLTLAVAMAGAGFHVDGVEVRDDVVDLLKQGKAHFFEPGLDDRLKRLVKNGRLQITKEIPAATKATIFIITVGTSLGEDHQVNLEPIKRSSSEIARHLKAGDMVIVRSTVRLGVTRSVVMPILDAKNVPYDIAFCPERTVEGQALAEIPRLPQIVGAETLQARLRATQMFNVLTPTVVQVPELETAEMIKLVDNTSRDVAFALSNEIAAICDRMGINACDVINAGKLGYARTNLPLPGPVGGPCLEKDPHILIESVRSTGFVPTIIQASRKTNEDQPAAVVARIKLAASKQPNWPAKPVISLLGLAFKGQPVTDDLRGTMAKPILTALRAEFPNATFRGYDALVTAEAAKEFFDLDTVPTIEAALDGANLVVIANNHPVFPGMPLENLAGSLARPAIIYDFWNSFSARNLELPEQVTYCGLGSGTWSSI